MNSRRLRTVILRVKDGLCPRDRFWRKAAVRQNSDVRLVPILLRKSFWGVNDKFLEALMRFTLGDVKDHIVSSKIDHGPSW
jgi:hypothetical protein